MRSAAAFVLALALALTGCADKTPVGDTGDVGGTTDDLDGDGYSSIEDCDDANGQVYPGATEICDGIDNDCDDKIDEDVSTTYYADADGDGFGDEDSSVEACEAPDGYVPTGNDCDDSTDAAFPGGTEGCDGIDNDCNGEIDDDDSFDATTFYRDFDEDGYGDATVSDTACEAPDGYVEDGTDCDDLDADTYPGADEYCDGHDDDCDGATDESAEDDEDGPGALDTTTYYADGDGDGYGDAAVETQACSVPSGYAADDTDCDDSSADIHPAATEVCNELDDDCDGDVDEDDASDAATWYADGDGDDYGDADSSTSACTEPSGYVADATDCDDDDDGAYPGAEEYCNGTDDDCDGTTDEADAVDASTYYADSDGDGYGDGTDTSDACSAPLGYVSDDTDCDDDDADINPGETESCNDLDDDCDGDVDEDSPTGSSTWYRDSDGDGYGSRTTTYDACDEPSGYVSDSTDCDDSDADIHPSADEYCDGEDNDCDGTTDEDDAVDASTWYRDYDRDDYGDASTTDTACTEPTGYTDNDEDCDDSVFAINPGATEKCDGVDNDCDGETDEDAGTGGTTYYADGDGDGYGNPYSTTEACAVPSGYVANSSDCDDSDSDISPGADEYCDDVDNDCDGTTDENDAVDASTWYRDYDSDDYGSSTVTRTACDEPAGYTDNDDDCNDSNGAVNPDATESCDGVDNDCDGDTDEDDASDASTWYADDDGDLYGDADDSTSACSKPSGYVSNSSDCDDSDADISPADTEVCDGADNDCDGDTDESDASDAGTWYADADGDGYGNASDKRTACSEPSGYIPGTGDCDDTDADINPDALEYCDGVDNDCDSSTDESDAEDVSTWYRDNDGDGYGNASDTKDACDQPSGYVDDDTDCLDTNSNANPGQEEICSDSVDNDCDDETDEDCPEEHCGTISSDETWSSDTDHLVTCDISVYGSSRPTLTIEDGAYVEFESGTGISVGSSSYGTLYIEGTTSGVTLTSAEDSPSEGDWDGLYIAYYDEGSVIEGATIEYAGNNGYGGIYLYNSDPEIIGCTIRNNSNHGIYNYYYSYPLIQDTEITENQKSGIYSYYYGYLDTDSTPGFSGNTITDNGEYAMVIYPDYIGEIDGDTTTISGNEDDFVYVYSGTVDGDADWPALDVPYYFGGGDVSIQGSARPEVTIEDGAEFYMASSVDLYVGNGTYGTLYVEGDVDTGSGVLFTSYRKDGSPSEGDWNGIYFGYYDEGSIVQGATVEYGGGNGGGNIYVYRSEPWILDSTITHSTSHGIYIYYYGYPTIQGTTISDNDNSGVYSYYYGYLETDGEPTFTDNTITDNGDYPVVMYADYIGQIDSSNSLSGNGDDFVYVIADTVESDANWQDLGVPYYVAGDVYVQGSGRPALTIDDGAEFYMASGSQLYVGSGSYGTLYVDGDWDTGEGVLFTSYRKDSGTPRGGDWDALYFGYYDEGSELNGFTAEYGGGGGYGNVYTYRSSPMFSDCELSESTTHGAYVYYQSYPAFVDCLIHDNDNSGIYTYYSTGLDDTYGISGTEIYDNGDYPIVVYPEYVGLIDDTNTFTDNGDEYVYVYSGTMSSDATWYNLDYPYYIAGDVTVYGSGRPVLEIEAGTTLEFASSAGLSVGTSGYGTLIADGTSTAPITFTAADSSPTAGDWDGLYLGYYCEDSDMLLDEVVVEYGGNNGYGNVYLYYCDATITNSDISYSKYYGIYRRYSSSASISGITYTSNASGNLY